MATPHINGEPGDFAETVIMPGDPLRAKFIAENFLDNPRMVTDVRGMLGFTGSYKGQALSVMGHGVGIPSCSLYCTELINEFGVKALAICSVSDQIISGEKLTVEERQSSFTEMISLALETAVAESTL